MIEQIFFYLGKYQSEILYSLVFFSITSYTGLFLILRRASLFGLALSQAAQFSLVLGMALHYLAHPGQISDNATADLLHMDLYVLPLTFLFMTPLVYLTARGLRESESLFALLLVLFTGLTPLAHKISGGTDQLLARLYFTEILYTPVETFAYYLPWLLAAFLLQLAYFRKFLTSGFDPVQARLTGLQPTVYNYFFYFLAGWIIALSARILGVYVTMAALLAPGLVALFLFRRLAMVITGTMLLSLVFSAAGYVTAFTFDNLPTEPILIVFFILSAAVLLLGKSTLSAAAQLIKAK